MEYIQKIKEDFLNKSMFESWAIVENRIYGTSPTLVHPCNMKKALLREIVPRSFKTDDMAEQIQIKQKEIAHRLNISVLPSDRPSGMLGQTALFEILRDNGFHFKRYLDHFYDKWMQSHLEGYVLLFTLGYIHYIRRFFGYPPIDLVKRLVEPITRYQLAIQWDRNWETRIKMNIFSVTPNNLVNKKIHRLIAELVTTQDGWGATANRVMKWTGTSHAEASHLLNIIRSSWVEHRYRIVSKNTGTVKVLTKSKSSSKSIPSIYLSCTSLLDNEEYFLSVTDVLKKDTDGKCFETESFNTNIERYDRKEQVWRLNSSLPATKTTSDIYALLQNSDHTIPDNSTKPTQRDLLFVALLTAMDTVHYPNKKQEIMSWLTEGYGIPKEDAENGIRNVMRKNLIRNQYTHYGIMDMEREFLAITIDDQSKKVIPFLGEVLPNLPCCVFQTNLEMDYGYIFDFHPSYLSNDIRRLITLSMHEHDVNGELFVIHSWGFGQPGSILRLIPDE